jgi:hypothetical protein
MARERAGRRAFRPALDDGRLEARLVLSQVKALPGRVSAAAAAVQAPVLRDSTFVTPHTANGGRALVIDDIDGEKWQLNVTGGGTIRAIPRPGGLVDLIVDGTNTTSELTINPRGHDQRKGTAHDFPVGGVRNDGLLHIGSINVTSGSINSILGFHTADLSGPIIIPGTTNVDRIAFSALNPGASILIGRLGANGVAGLGDLNTLDVLNSINLTSGPGIVIGRDLNLLNVGGAMTLANGANLVVGRDLGLTPQPAKGSGLGGAGAFILGDLTIDPGSVVLIVRSMDNAFRVLGFAAPDTLGRFFVGPGSVLKTPIVFQDMPGSPNPNGT